MNSRELERTKNLIRKLYEKLSLENQELLLSEITDYLTEFSDVESFKKFEKSIGRAITHFEYSIIQNFKEEYNFDDEVIVKSINEAKKQGVTDFNYINAILLNWYRSGIKESVTVEDVETSDIVHSDFDWTT